MTIDQFDGSLIQDNDDPNDPFAWFKGQPPEQLRTLIEGTEAFKGVPEKRRAGVMKALEKQYGFDLTIPEPELPVEEPSKGFSNPLAWETTSWWEGQKAVGRGAEEVALTLFKPFIAVGGATAAALRAGLEPENLGKSWIDRIKAQDAAAGQYFWDVMKARRFEDLPADDAEKIVERLFPGLDGWAKTGATVATALILDPLIIGPAFKMGRWQKALDEASKRVMNGSTIGVLENAALQLISYLPRSPQADTTFRSWLKMARRGDLGNPNAARKLVSEIINAMPNDPAAGAATANPGQWAQDILGQTPTTPAGPSVGPNPGGWRTSPTRTVPSSEEAAKLLKHSLEEAPERLKDLKKVIETGTAKTPADKIALKSEVTALKGLEAALAGKAEPLMMAMREAQQALQPGSLKWLKSQTRTKDEYTALVGQLSDTYDELSTLMVAAKVSADSAAGQQVAAFVDQIEALMVAMKKADKMDQVPRTFLQKDIGKLAGAAQDQQTEEAISGAVRMMDITSSFGESSRGASPKVAAKLGKTTVDKLAQLLGLEIENLQVVTVKELQASLNTMTQAEMVEQYGMELPKINGMLQRFTSQGTGGNFVDFGSRGALVVLDSTLTGKNMASVLAHELGHVWLSKYINQLPKETLSMMRKAYADALEQSVKKEGLPLGQSPTGIFARLRTPMVVDTLQPKLAKQGPAQQADKALYGAKFGEWFSDQVSHWATTSQVALTPMEKIFQNVANMIRKIYAATTGRYYIPNKELQTFFNDWAKKMAPDLVSERRGKYPAELRNFWKTLSPAQQEEKALLDPLTGVPNRMAFENTPKAKFIAEVDLDSLKWVNDNMSEAQGDELIKALTKALADAAPGKVYRLGGDEIVIRGNSQKELNEALKKAREALAKVTITDGERTLTGPRFAAGIGKDLETASKRMKIRKDADAAKGIRVRGERPPNAEGPPGLHESGGAAKPATATPAAPTTAIPASATDPMTGTLATPQRAMTSAMMDVAPSGKVGSREVGQIMETLLEDYPSLFPTEVLAKFQDVKLGTFRKAIEAVHKGDEVAIRNAMQDIFEEAGVSIMQNFDGPSAVTLGKILNNQTGGVSPAMMRSAAPHLAALVTGFELDAEDGLDVGPFKLSWSMEKYLSSGARISGLVLGVKGTAALHKAHGEKLWSKMETHMPGFYRAIRTFHESERLPKELWAYRQNLTRGPDILLRRYARQLQELQKQYTPDELKAISDFVEQEGPDWYKASEKVRDGARQIKAVRDRSRDMLIEAGFPEEVISKYGDQYLHRVYDGKHNTLMEKAAKFFEISGSYMMRRGPQPKILKKDQLQDMAGAVGELTAGQKVYEYTDLAGVKLFVHEKDPALSRVSQTLLRTHTYELEEVAEKGWGLKRDYTRWERQAMGENRDSIVRSWDFMREVANDVILGKAFMEISQNPALAVNRAGRQADQAKYAGWVMVPHSKNKAGVERFGKLAGQYVNPEVMYLLNSMTSRRFMTGWQEAAFKINKKLLGYWKIGKTALQTSTHGVNTFSNVMLSWMRGDNPAKVSYEGAMSVLKQDENYWKAVDAGLLDGNILRAETDIKNYSQGLVSYTDQLKKFQDLPFFSQVKAVMGNSLSQPVKGMVRLYEFEDEMFKVGTFIQELRRGADDATALRGANEMFFDYRDVPRGIAAVRDLGIVPFITWTYKAAHAIPRLINRRPERAAAVMAAWQMWNDANYAVTFDNAAKEAEQRERFLAPKWMSGQHERMFGGLGPPMAARQAGQYETPQGDEVAKFREWGRWVLPLSDITQTKAGTFLLGHPLAAAAMGSFFNKHPQFQRFIMPHEQQHQSELTEEQQAENVRAWTEFAAQVLLPNMPYVPGSFSQKDMARMLVSEGLISKEIGSKYFGVTGNDNSGIPVTASRYLGDMVGLKTRAINMSRGQDMAYVGAYHRVKEAEKNLSRLHINQAQTGSVTDREFERATNALISARQRYVKELGTVNEHKQGAEKSTVREGQTRVIGPALSR